MPLFDVEAKIPVITMWEPWATWVKLGWKTIESREHNRFRCLVGRRIAICAAKHWDKGWLRDAAPFLSTERIEQTEQFQKTREPGLICTAMVDSSRLLWIDDEPKALIECLSVRRYGLFLKDVRVIEPVPVKGRQGISYVSVGLISAEGL